MKRVTKLSGYLFADPVGSRLVLRDPVRIRRVIYSIDVVRAVKKFKPLDGLYRITGTQRFGGNHRVTVRSKVTSIVGEIQRVEKAARSPEGKVNARALADALRNVCFTPERAP